jgi:signal transduction histidine kinase
MALRDALTDVDRLEATLTDLLALARDIPSDRRPVDLAVLLQGVDATWRGRLAPLGRALRVNVADDTPAVLVSATALSTVIDVLVENALRHGHGTVTVEASGARGGGATITIADEGHLRTDDPDAIFHRRSAQAAGHGIGLALARSLAHAEGARLLLGRREPTTFEVVLAAAVPALAAERVMS